MNSLKRSKILLVLLGAFIIRVIVFVNFQPWDLHVQNESVFADDADSYQTLALCILEDATFCGDTFRTPGYPFFIAAIYSIVGIKPWAVLLAQMFVNLLTIYIVFKLGELIASQRAGIIAATLVAIDPIQVFSVTYLYNDSLFATLLLASFYFYIKGLKLHQLKYLMFAGAFLGLATLTRPIAQYCLFIMAVFALLWPAQNAATKVKCSAAFVLFFALTISPWLYRNYVLYDTVKVSSIQGLNLLFWQVTYARTWETGQPDTVVKEQFEAEAKALGYSTENNPFANEAIAQKIALKYILEHSHVYAWRLLLGIVHTYVNLDTSGISKRLGISSTQTNMFAAESESKLISEFFRSKSTPEIVIGMIVFCLLLINYLMFALGVHTLLKRREFSILAFFLVTMAYFSVAGGVIGISRFRMPIAPFVILIGAIYLDSLLSRRQSNVPILSH